MVSILKSIGVTSCSFVLCLSLANVTQAGVPTNATEKMKHDPCPKRKGNEPNPVKCNKETQQGIHTIRGEVLHINGDRLLVKETDGEEAIFHIDLSTQVSGHIGPGSRIEAKVYEVEGEKYALSINQPQ